MSAAVAVAAQPAAAPQHSGRHCRACSRVKLSAVIMVASLLGNADAQDRGAEQNSAALLERLSDLFFFPPGGSGDVRTTSQATRMCAWTVHGQDSVFACIAHADAYVDSLLRHLSHRLESSRGPLAGQPQMHGAAAHLHCAQCHVLTQRTRSQGPPRGGGPRAQHAQPWRRLLQHPCPSPSPSPAPAPAPASAPAPA
jgi:hypothetical protein